MNEDLYNFLVDNNYLTHGIGDVHDKETYFKFESILKNGGLMSMKFLKEKGINVSGKSVGVRNTSEEKISFFDPSVPEIRKRLFSKYYYCFLPFDPNVIFFVVDQNNIEVSRHPHIDFEMVYTNDFVSIDNFKGIIAPKECAEYLNNIQNQYGVSLPIYDFDFNMINTLNDSNNIKK